MTQLSGREIQLDVVRGIAILLAVGWHFNSFTGNIAFDALMLPGRAFGWAGVDLFFVLSGFLIGRLILKEVRATSTFSYKRFLLRRAFRLWPVLYLYVIAQLLIGGKPWDSYLFQVLFHVQNYFPTPLAGLWSLAVEEHFYLAAGLALPFLAAHRASPRTYAILLLCVMVASLAARIIGFYLGESAQALQSYTHYRADALACGLLMAVVAFEWPEAFEKLKRPRALWLALAVVGFTCLWPMAQGPIRNTVGFTVAYMASAALILAIDGARLSRFATLVATPFAFLGLYSYSLYIWHFPIGTRLSEALVARIGPQPTELVIALKYALALAGALVISKLIEHPFIRLRDRLFPTARAKTLREHQLDETSGNPRAG